MDATSEKPIVFIDGFCVLCDKLADLIIRKDRRRRMLIATLQGETFDKLKVQLKDQEVPDSVVLYLNGAFYFRSAAVLRIAGLLPFPYNLVKVFRLLPRFLADGVYNWLAGRRYSIFGKRQKCRLPAPHERELCLD